LEQTIYLPDSLGELSQPRCLVYDSANNTVYVADGNVARRTLAPGVYFVRQPSGVTKVVVAS
jgi:hypothetical protein